MARLRRGAGLSRSQRQKKPRAFPQNSADIRAAFAAAKATSVFDNAGTASSQFTIETAALKYRSITRKWSVQPWEILEANLAPATWSKHLLEELASLANTGIDLEGARKRLTAVINKRADAAAEGTQPTNSRPDRKLMVADVQSVKRLYKQIDGDDEVDDDQDDEASSPKQPHVTRDAASAKSRGRYNTRSRVSVSSDHEETESDFPPAARAATKQIKNAVRQSHRRSPSDASYPPTATKQSHEVTADGAGRRSGKLQRLLQSQSPRVPIPPKPSKTGVKRKFNASPRPSPNTKRRRRTDEGPDVYKPTLSDREDPTLEDTIASVEQARQAPPDADADFEVEDIELLESPNEQVRLRGSDATRSPNKARSLSRMDVEEISSSATPGSSTYELTEAISREQQEDEDIDYFLGAKKDAQAKQRNHNGGGATRRRDVYDLISEGEESGSGTSSSSELNYRCWFNRCGTKRCMFLGHNVVALQRHLRAAHRVTMQLDLVHKCLRQAQQEEGRGDDLSDTSMSIVDNDETAWTRAEQSQHRHTGVHGTLETATIAVNGSTHRAGLRVTTPAHNAPWLNDAVITVRDRDSDKPMHSQSESPDRIPLVVTLDVVAGRRPNTQRAASHAITAPQNDANHPADLNELDGSTALANNTPRPANGAATQTRAPAQVPTSEDMGTLLPKQGLHVDEDPRDTPMTYGGSAIMQERMVEDGGDDRWGKTEMNGGAEAQGANVGEGRPEESLEQLERRRNPNAGHDPSARFVGFGLDGSRDGEESSQIRLHEKRKRRKDTDEPRNSPAPKRERAVSTDRPRRKGQPASSEASKSGAPPQATDCPLHQRLVQLQTMVRNIGYTDCSATITTASPAPPSVPPPPPPIDPQLSQIETQLDNSAVSSYLTECTHALKSLNYKFHNIATAFKQVIHIGRTLSADLERALSGAEQRIQALERRTQEKETEYTEKEEGLSELAKGKARLESYIKTDPALFRLLEGMAATARAAAPAIATPAVAAPVADDSMGVAAEDASTFAPVTATVLADTFLATEQTTISTLRTTLLALREALDRARADAAVRRGDSDACRTLLSGLEGALRMHTQQTRAVVEGWKWAWEQDIDKDAD